MILLLLACAPEVPPDVEVHRGAVVVHAADVDAVAVEDASGAVLARRHMPAPVDTLELPVAWEPGPYTVRIDAAGQAWELPVDVPALPPLEVWVEAPVGQGRTRPGERVPLTLLGGHPAQVAVVARAWEPGELTVRLGEVEVRREVRRGEQVVALAEVRDEVTGSASLLDTEQAFLIAPTALSAAVARRELALDGVVFPADRTGHAELSRPAGRVTLPSPLWRRSLRRLGLGTRARDPWAPWAHTGVVLSSTGDAPVSVVVRQRILGPDGEPAAAFRPRVRGAGDGSGSVTALLRVPPGEQARAALPVFLDEGAVDPEVVYTRVVEVLPLGSREPLHRREEPLYVSAGSAPAGLAFALAVLSALAGTVLLLRQGPRWLRDLPTSELMTAALFGALVFAVGAAGQLLGLGVGALLGPFAPLLTGLVDDALRYALLATLVTLIPRPGAASLALLTSWLVSGLALGTFSPTDLLFLGTRVAWLEGSLWVAGVTRSRRWLDQGPVARWARLTLAFGTTALVTTATGLAVHAVLYRLFFADWYVALLLLGPGSVYVAVAMGLAVPFAGSLRRVQR